MRTMQNYATFQSIPTFSLKKKNELNYNFILMDTRGFQFACRNFEIFCLVYGTLKIRNTFLISKNT